MFMELLDATVLLTALPRMAETFGRSPVDLSIGVTAYLLSFAALIPASGWVAERYGTRNVFAAAIGLFVAASVLCGLSNSLEMFAAARVLQGAAASMMSPVGRMTMMRVVERQQLARAINWVAMAGLVGPTIGPPLGGFITTYWSWRWIFFINVPIGLIGIVLVWRLFPNLRASQQRRFDGRGFLLNAGALAGIVYGLHQLTESSVDWRSGAALTVAGAILTVFAVRHALKAHHPLLDLTPLRIASFRASAAGGALFRVALFAPNFLLPLMLQLGLGMNAFVGAAADVLIKLAVIPLLRLYGLRSMLVHSAWLYALFLLALMLISAQTHWVVLGLLLSFGGAVRSLQMTAVNTVMIVDVPGSQVNAATTFSAVSQQASQAVSVALAALIINITVWWLGDSAAALRIADFRPALLLATLASLATLRWYLPLPESTGAEISGHRRRP
jgi:EmrB/QacA subfamily drug resistance transporter